MSRRQGQHLNVRPDLSDAEWDRHIKRLQVRLTLGFGLLGAVVGTLAARGLSWLLGGAL